METWVLELSKSRMMMYDYCQYKYKRVYLDKKQQPDTKQTLLGTRYHSLRDTCIAKVDVSKITKDFNQNYSYIRSLMPDEEDRMLDTIAKIEAERAVVEEPKLYKPVIVETAYKTVFCDPRNFKYYPDSKTADIARILNAEQIADLNQIYGLDPIIILKGKPDNIYLLDDGTYSVYEFKTGSWNAGTATKIRKELIFYAMVLEPHLDAEINYISYCYAAVDKIVLEKIQRRSITAFQNLMYKIIISHVNDSYSQKFYYKACKNCFLCPECEMTSPFRR